MGEIKRRLTKKWSRAKAPRVRTGCLTCKKRHLKCDERKPLCKRCEDDRYTCDGYELNPTRNPPRNLRAMIPSYDRASYPRLLPGLSLDTSETSNELQLLYHVRTCTVEDLASSLSPMEFWHTHVLPRSHGMKSLKHAMCALGSAHKYFKFQYLKSSTTSQMISEIQRDSIRHYNQAIRSIQPHIQSPTAENIEVVLMCCVIFICIENLQGRYNECLRHIHAAAAILISYLNDPSSFLTAELTTAKFAKRPEIFDVVIQMLVRLGQDISTYTGDDMVPDLNFFPPANISFNDPNTAFSSAAEAETALNALEMALATALNGGQMDGFMGHFDHSPFDSPLLQELDGTSTSPEIATICFTNIEPYFRHWSTRFDLYRAKLDERAVSKQELHQVAALAIEQALWQGTMRIKSIEADFHPEDADELLRRADFLASCLSDTTPVFAFDGNLIPVLSIICTSCPDVDIQKRCINQLRSMRRREGVWDSQETADILEAMIMAREQNLIAWGDFPEELPLLAERLRSLHLTQTEVPQGILLLTGRDTI